MRGDGIDWWQLGWEHGYGWHYKGPYPTFPTRIAEEDYEAGYRTGAHDYRQEKD